MAGKAVNMKLNPNCNFASFLETVRQCSGDVYFTTPEGDILNLKSELCRYIFAVVVSTPRLLETGELICNNETDVVCLRPFLV